MVKANTNFESTMLNARLCADSSVCVIGDWETYNDFCPHGYAHEICLRDPNWGHIYKKYNHLEDQGWHNDPYCNFRRYRGRDSSHHRYVQAHGWDFGECENDLVRDFWSWLKKLVLLYAGLERAK